uniref:Lipase_3 domain-containing protein n=1 Tax=Panagrellus redivivus TaxID=6233 RepID=A0A7E4W2G6_PANRE
MSSFYGVFIVLNCCGLINLISAGVPLHPLKTGYNEAEAMALMNLAAGAYGKSPEGCIKQTFLGTHPRVIYHMTNQICDEFTNQCGAYILADDANRHLYVVFRGTKTKAQLLTEGWHSLKPNIDFYGVGKANTYFFKALNVMWASVEQALNDHSDYQVTFTGHSLGGALASLAALKTVVFGHRNGRQIKLVTFGQPRVGNVALAMKHNELVPFSYRVVHSIDIVPHLPGCAKNEIMGASHDMIFVH